MPRKSKWLRYGDALLRTKYQTGVSSKNRRNEPSSTTFKEYFEKQPESFQRNWLGKERIKAYQKGTLKLEDLVKHDNRYVRNIAELRESGKIEVSKSP
ncbi:MAG: hypothetical protein LBU34_15145, partial [Planctomycetaceae bacterium]|nr:hypothetical protein [Planctomycetaceae bacterium]